MTRIQSLASRPKRTLGALAVVLAAVGITVGSGANFQASKANAGTFAAGTLSIGNLNNQSVFQGVNMRPGDSVTGSVDVSNTGSLSGNFYLSQDLSGTSTAVADQALLSRLKLTITDCGPASAPDCTTPVGGAPVYDGLMTAFGSQKALKRLALPVMVAKWPATESHHFKFDVLFPNDPTAADGSDDAAQGGAVAATYTWKATS